MSPIAVRNLLQRCGGMENVRSDWGQLLVPSRAVFACCTAAAFKLFISHIWGSLSDVLHNKHDACGINPALKNSRHD